MLLLLGISLFFSRVPVLNDVLGLAWDCGAVTTGPIGGNRRDVGLRTPDKKVAGFVPRLRRYRKRGLRNCGAKAQI